MKRCRRIFGLLVLLLFASLPAGAKTYQAMPDILLELTLPSADWQASRTPPEFLVQGFARDLSEGMLRKAQQAGIETREQAARKMLGRNELFVYHPSSEAHLEIDLSPLRQDEQAPTAGALKKSACYAGESMKGEEGFSEVEYSCAVTDIEGFDHAYRVDARFSKDNRRNRFVGVVGFIDHYWVYLYFTDPGGRSPRLEELEQLLGTVRFWPGPE